ncbi:hypothetical protein [Hymenobacter coccineus]|uniref:hypothetical protein n=1 Tax=Hymenobacter coccineus TaxID=1908235 RepID=UPI0013012AEF|nr:hypothetical protein [Hymenobacter coccineus]
MRLSAEHLQLVFMASTVTPTSAAGWIFTTTPVPQPVPSNLVCTPLVIRLAVVAY